MAASVYQRLAAFQRRPAWLRVLAGVAAGVATMGAVFGLQEVAKHTSYINMKPKTKARSTGAALSTVRGGA